MIDDFKVQTQQTNKLSNEVQELQQEAREHLANSKSDNTKRAYASDWKQFEEWCQTYALESLPAEPETLVYYITLLGKTKKASTIKRKMTAISQRHETTGFKSPTKTALVKGVWEGIQRKIGIKEEGMEALWLHELRQVIEALPINKLIGIRNKALLVIGWAAALRRSELVSLNIEDISKTRDGLILQLNRTKTDQRGEGHMIALPYGSTPLTCPIRSFEDWVVAARITGGPVFRRMDRHGNVLGRLTDQSVRLVVRKSCEEVGLDSLRYGAHSLRSGFCSQAAKSGKSEHQIMRQTRHKRSDSLQRYIKKANLFEDNAASGIGL